MRFPRAQAVGMGITFWAMLAVLYPAVKVLETCERVYTAVRTHMKKERT